MTRPFARIFVPTAFLTHALGAAVAGSLNPFIWPGMVLGAAVFILAPCIALGVATIEGALG